MRENDEYSAEDFKARIAEIDGKINELRMLSNTSELENYNVEEGIQFAIDSMTNILKNWLSLDIALRIKFQKLIFPNGICYTKNSGFGTPELGCILRLNSEYSTDKLQNEHLVDPNGFEPLTSSVQMRRSTN